MRSRASAQAIRGSRRLTQNVELVTSAHGEPATAASSDWSPHGFRRALDLYGRCHAFLPGVARFGRGLVAECGM